MPTNPHTPEIRWVCTQRLVHFSPKFEMQRTNKQLNLYHIVCQALFWVELSWVPKTDLLIPKACFCFFSPYIGSTHRMRFLPDVLPIFVTLLFVPKACLLLSSKAITLALHFLYVKPDPYSCLVLGHLVNPHSPGPNPDL